MTVQSESTNICDIIRMDGVSKTFHHGRAVALESVSIGNPQGQVAVIIGPSGSGKSTLLRSINYLEVPTFGTVTVDGIRLSSAENINRGRTDVGMVFQQFNLFPHLTVLGNVTLAQRITRRRTRQRAADVASDLLKKVGIPEKANWHPAQLSGGQQQRVAIARALAMQPKIMLFGEPTSRLDPEMITEVLDVMLVLAQEGMTMVVVSQKIGFARNAADRMIFVDEGLIVADTTPEDLLHAPMEERTKAFLSRILH